MKRGWVGVFVLVLAFAAVPAGASAATFTVNTTGDPSGPGCTGGGCSFRQAVAQADAQSGDDTINFNLPAGSTIALDTSQVDIMPTNFSDKLDIVGPGASNLTIKGASGQIVLRFDGGTNSLSGVTVTGGSGTHQFNATGVDKEGGTLTLDSVVVTGNTNDGNQGNAAGGVLNVSSSQDGSPTMIIRNSTISNNTVNNAANQAVFGGGGGVVSHPGKTLIVNSTITGNSVHGQGSNQGGGVWAAEFGGGMTLVNVTIAHNSVDGGGGGLRTASFDSVNLANTIIAQNSSGSGTPDCSTGTPAMTTSQGYNLLGSGDGCSMTPKTGDKVGSNASYLDPHLAGSLGNNGGATPTLALLQGSPAIDGGNPAAVSNTEPPPDAPALIPCRTTDQRGIVRPQLGACDIGAYEYAPGVASATAPPCSQNGLVTVTVTPPQGGFSQAVHYQIDNGPEQRAPTQNNQATVQIPQGAHTLTYWAESQAATRSSPRTTSTSAWTTRRPWCGSAATSGARPTAGASSPR